MIYAVRKKGESADRLINRFKKQVTHSRLTQTVRKGRYRQKPINERQKKSAAVMREHYRAERQKKMYYDYQQKK